MKHAFLMMAILLSACGNESSPPDMVADDPVSGGATAASRNALVPPYPGSTPFDLTNMAIGAAESRSVNTTGFETDASVEAVAAFYRAHFRQAGVAIQADTVTPANGGLMGVARDGERGALLAIFPSNGKTRITVTIGR